MLKEEIKNIYYQEMLAYQSMCNAIKIGDVGSYTYHESQVEFFDGQSKALMGVTLDKHLYDIIENRGKSYGCDLENSRNKYDSGELSQYEFGSECMSCIGILSIVGPQVINEIIS